MMNQNYCLLFPFYSLNNSELLHDLTATRLAFDVYCDNLVNPFEFSDNHIADYDPNSSLSPSCMNTILNCSYKDVEDFISWCGDRNGDRFISVCLNIRSVPKNLEEFLLDFEVHSVSYDMICFCETRLVDGLGELYNVDNYKMFTNNRNTRGGGVTIYANKKYESVMSRELTVCTDTIESLFVSTSVYGVRYLGGCIYRPPNTDLQNFLIKITEVLGEVNRRFNDHIVVIHGDFNIDLMTMETNHMVQQFVFLMFEHGFLPVILRPSRVCTTTASLIDHIWINKPDRLANAGIVTSTISDHFAVYADIGLPCSREKSREKKYITIERRKDTPEKRAALSAAIARCDWNDIAQDPCIQSAYTKFAGVLVGLYERFFPFESIRVRQKDVEKPYITSELKCLIKNKRKLQKLYNKWPLTYESEYKRMRNSLNSKIREHKHKYYKEQLNRSKGNCRDTWKVIRSVLGRTRNNEAASKMFVNGRLTDSPVEISQEFNGYFSSVGSDLARNFVVTDQFKKFLPAVSCDNFVFSPVTCAEVSQLTINE